MNNIKNPIDHLKQNYGKSDSVVSFLSPRRIYDFYNKKLTMKEILEFLETSESYTLLKFEQKRRIFDKTLVYHPRDLFQGDLFYFD